MSEIVSRPYKPDPEHCCEACVFGKGPHTGATPLALITDQYLADEGLQPLAHWHRDGALKAWLMPVTECDAIVRQAWNRFLNRIGYATQVQPTR